MLESGDASRWTPRNACGDRLYTDEELAVFLAQTPRAIAAGAEPSGYRDYSDVGGAPGNPSLEDRALAAGGTCEFWGIGKLGRAVSLVPARWGSVGGDNEFVELLLDMHEELEAHGRNVVFVLLSRCSDGKEFLPRWVRNAWQEYSIPRFGRQPLGDEGYTAAQCAVAQHIGTEDSYQNVLKPWVPMLSNVVMLLGQHGTTNMRVPMADGSGLLTSPLDMSGAYSGPLVMLTNDWEDGPYGESYEEAQLRAPGFARRVTWICHDSRNYLKARDVLRGPAPVLGQYNWERSFRDMTDRIHKHKYTYACAELGGVTMPDAPPAGAEVRDVLFGLIVNETAKVVAADGLGVGRLECVLGWAVPVFKTVSVDVEYPAPVMEMVDAGVELVNVASPVYTPQTYLHGTWSPESQEQVKLALGPEFASLFPVKGVVREHVLSLLGRTRYSVTFPGNGQGWVTAKVWEGWSCGVIMFLHPLYDTQRSLFQHARLCGADEADVALLEEWLRPPTPEAMLRAIAFLESEENTVFAERIREAQWNVFVVCKEYSYHLRAIFENAPVA